VSFGAKRINAAALLKDGEYSLIFVKFAAQVTGEKRVSVDLRKTSSMQPALDEVSSHRTADHLC